MKEHTAQIEATLSSDAAWAKYNTLCTAIRSAAALQCAELMEFTQNHTRGLAEVNRDIRERAKKEAREEKERVKQAERDAITARREQREADAKRKYEAEQAARMAADKRAQAARDLDNQRRALADITPAAPVTPSAPSAPLAPLLTNPTMTPENVAKSKRFRKERSEAHAAEMKAIGRQPDVETLRTIWAQCDIDAGIIQ